MPHRHHSLDHRSRQVRFERPQQPAYSSVATTLLTAPFIATPQLTNTKKMKEGRSLRDCYNYSMNDNKPCIGMSLSIKSANDDFETNLYRVSTYAEFSGNDNMRDNDVVDMLNYLAAKSTDLSDITSYPYLQSVDALGHAFLDSYLVAQEVERLADYAGKSGDKDIEQKLTRILNYCKTAHDGGAHHILQFDGM